MKKWLEEIKMTNMKHYNLKTLGCRVIANELAIVIEIRGIDKRIILKDYLVFA